MTLSFKTLCFVAVGGGSVGDFVGFMASVFKRGSTLIQIPSTWLAAIDSAHGGKTALNIKCFKNQIGTFYPAQKIILCKQLLLTQPTQRTDEALGEIIKTALLSGGTLWNQISQETAFNSLKLWKYLPQLISYKYKIVEKDPFEKEGLRYVLNLGHTFGHTFELYFKIPHGEAVNIGLVLALELSKVKKIMKPQVFNKIHQTPLLKCHLASNLKVSALLRKHKEISKLLAQDKKISLDGKINFVYIKSPGHPVVLSVSIQELTHFSQSF
jgi:3-dehydroquinate synthase